MRQIDKETSAPAELISVQDEIAKDLFEKKDKFIWRTEHYSDPVKEELKHIYNNKCAFCETKLTETDNENKFTIEHFRPKSHYYWLGNEWTNLFPTCLKCNNNKADDFPLFMEKNRIEPKNDAPFDASGNLIRELCNANNENLKKEKPLFLHPEIDSPEKYFKFEPSGKVVVNEKLNDKFEKAQAQKMIDKFLGRPTVEEKRKEKILNFKKRLVDLLIKATPELEQGYTQKDIKFLFLGFFTDLQEQEKKEAEFSWLGHYMVEDFNKFFLEEIKDKFGEELKALVEYAYNLFFEK